jgi:hypothetical protein
VEEAQDVQPLVRNDHTIHTTLARVVSRQVQGVDAAVRAVPNRRIAPIGITLLTKPALHFISLTMIHTCFVAKGVVETFFDIHPRQPRFSEMS